MPDITELYPALLEAIIGNAFFFLFNSSVTIEVTWGTCSGVKLSFGFKVPKIWELIPLTSNEDSAALLPTAVALFTSFKEICAFDDMAEHSNKTNVKMKFLIVKVLIFKL